MNDYVLQKYEIFLRPEKTSLDKIISYQQEIKNSLTTTPSSGIHMTLFGFYSDTVLAPIKKSFSDELYELKMNIKTKGIDIYNERAVIVLDKNPELLCLHNKTLSIFKERIIFKNEKIPYTVAHEDLFKERYPYVGENYSPHISLGKTNALIKDLQEVFIDAKIEEICFDRMILASKNNKTTNYLAEKTMS